MNCEKVIGQFSAYLDGQLTAAEREAVRSHLADCARCRDELDALARTVYAVADLPRLRAPSDLREQVMAKLDGVTPAEGAPAAVAHVLERRSGRGFRRRHHAPDAGRLRLAGPSPKRPRRPAKNASTGQNRNGRKGRFRRLERRGREVSAQGGERRAGRRDGVCHRGSPTSIHTGRDNVEQADRRQRAGVERADRPPVRESSGRLFQRGRRRSQGRLAAGRPAEARGGRHTAEVRRSGATRAPGPSAAARVQRQAEPGAAPEERAGRGRPAGRRGERRAGRRGAADVQGRRGAACVSRRRAATWTP